MDPRCDLFSHYYLREKVSFELAEFLLQQNIPFIFVTGYGRAMEVPGKLANIEILTRPVDDGSLSKAYASILNLK